MPEANCAIFGGSGYGTSELLRLLLGHPVARVRRVVSSSKAGAPIESVHRHMRGLTDLAFSADGPGVLDGIDTVFLALPHGEAMTRAGRLLAEKSDLRIVDLSADFRVQDAALYETYYGRPHTAKELLPRFVYGLSEWRAGEIAAARCVANPGCFATASLLALLPLAHAGFLEGDCVIDGKTGSSGSGATPAAGTHHPERAENFRAYKPLAHQHLAELTQEVRRTTNAEVRLRFVPHSAPMTRGIFATIYAFPRMTVTRTDLAAAYRSAYGDCPFVRVLAEIPELGPVLRTNFCDIGFEARDGAICVFSAMDNLVKGMSGQAVQNLNLMLGLPETTGLLFAGCRP